MSTPLFASATSTVTTAMVFVMVFIAAIFFFVVDQALSYGVRVLFGLGQ